MNQQINWSPGVTLEQVEKEIIIRALNHYGGNKTTTANALGIALRTLDNKLEKYEVDKLEVERIRANERTRREEFQRRARGLPQSEALPIGTAGGLRLESTSDASAKSAVSVQERQKVQEMPQATASGNHSRKAR